MANNDLILIEELCIHYKVNISFFNDLEQIGLINPLEVESIKFIHQDSLSELEKIIRLHQELNINLEGIDIILNLLKKQDELRIQINSIQNRLRIYEID